MSILVQERSVAAAAAHPSRGTSTWRATLTHPAVWLGLAGAMLIALGELRRLATWNQVRGQGWVATVSSWVTQAQYPVLIVTGIVTLAVAWLWLRPGRRTDGGAIGSVGPLVAVVVLWSLPLLALPPMLSTDAGSYADLGWTVSLGQSPYDVGLGTTGSPFPYGRAWRGTTSVYPAFALQLFGWVTQATGMHWYWSVVALRVLAVAGLGLLVWAVPRLARTAGVDPMAALWFAVLNPLVLVHGVGGEHIDLLMVGLAAAGVAVAARPAWWGLGLGAVVIGLAAAVKQPALLAVPAAAGVWLLHRRTRTATTPDEAAEPGPVEELRPPATPWRDVLTGWVRLVAAAAAAGAVAVASFVGVSYATGLGLGWVDGTGNPANASQTITPAWLVATLTGGAVDWWTEVASLAAVGAIGVLWLAYGRREPLRFLALAALAFTLGFEVLREWYLIVPLALMGLARPGKVLGPVTWWLSSALAVYGVAREYQRVSLLASFQQAALLGLVATAAGWGAWWLWQRFIAAEDGPGSAEHAVEAAARPRSAPGDEPVAGYEQIDGGLVDGVVVDGAVVDGRMSGT